MDGRMEEPFPTPGRPPETPEARPDRKGAFRLLFFALLTIGAGNTMVANAVLPPLARELELPDWTVGAIFSLSAICWSLTSPFWGGLSGRIGRRPVAVIGLSGYALSMTLFGISAWLAISGVLTSWPVIFGTFLAARSLFGLFGSGTNPSAQAYVADRTHEGERTREIAALSSGFSFGAISGPAIAATLVSLFGLVSPFFVAAGCAAFMAFLIWTRLPEIRDPDAALNYVKPPKGLWRQRDVWPLIFFAVMVSLATGISLQTFPFALMDKLSVDGAEASGFIAVATTMGAMATILAQLVLIPRLNPTNRTLMIWGGVLFGVGVLVIAPSNALAPLVLAQFGIGLGQGLARAGFSAGASLAVRPEQQGAVAGLIISANGMGFIVSPFFGPFLYESVSRTAPFVIAGVLMLLMAIFMAVKLPRAS